MFHHNNPDGALECRARDRVAGQQNVRGCLVQVEWWHLGAGGRLMRRAVEHCWKTKLWMEVRLHTYDAISSGIIYSDGRYSRCKSTTVRSAYICREIPNGIVTTSAALKAIRMQYQASGQCLARVLDSSPLAGARLTHMLKLERKSVPERSTGS